MSGRRPIGAVPSRGGDGPVNSLFFGYQGRFRARGGSACEKVGGSAAHATPGEKVGPITCCETDSPDRPRLKLSGFSR